MIQYLYIGLFSLGMLLLYFAMKQYYKTRDLLTYGIKTTATVSDLITVSSDDGYSYKPVFQYTDQRQNIKEHVSEITSRPAPYQVGDKVQIIYNPNEEGAVKVISFWGLYRWTIVLLCIAAPLLIIGGGYLLYHQA